MIDFASASKPTAVLYKLLIGSVVPRPVAWIATRGPAGDNLAPFSFFNGVTSSPPTIAFSVIDRDGAPKDTSKNLEHNSGCIVHIVSAALSEKMNLTCADFGEDISEFVEAGLTAVPGRAVDAPRIAEAPIAFECRMTHHLRIGGCTSHFLAEIVHWHYHEDLLNERLHVAPEALDAIGRMGGMNYTNTRQRFAIDRPQIAAEDPRSIPAYRKRLRSASR